MVNKIKISKKLKSPFGFNTGSFLHSENQGFSDSLTLRGRVSDSLNFKMKGESKI